MEAGLTAVLFLFCLSFSPVRLYPPPLFLTCSFQVCVCLWPWRQQQHGAPAPHLLITLRLHYPDLSTTSVPDYSVTRHSPSAPPLCSCQTNCLPACQPTGLDITPAFHLNASFRINLFSLSPVSASGFTKTQS